MNRRPRAAHWRPSVHLGGLSEVQIWVHVPPPLRYMYPPPPPWQRVWRYSAGQTGTVSKYPRSRLTVALAFVFNLTTKHILYVSSPKKWTLSFIIFRVNVSSKNTDSIAFSCLACFMRYHPECRGVLNRSCKCVIFTKTWVPWFSGNMQIGPGGTPPTLNQISQKSPENLKI